MFLYYSSICNPTKLVIGIIYIYIYIYIKCLVSYLSNSKQAKIVIPTIIISL